jgi:predicted aminopeptidase
MLVTQSGCYYGHLGVGQAKLLWAREPVDQLLADPSIDPKLRARLERVAQARAFAKEIGLEVGEQYTSYVPWPDDRIVTSVIATEAGSIESSPFRFPIVGEVPYKGFFDRDRAKREADQLRERGMDVCVSGIRAYSTLGWFDDPLTAPMLETSDDRLFETVIHELVHATVFVKSQPDFNEGAANFIGEEATVAFFARDTAATVDPRARIDDDRRISLALMALRDEVAALYEQPLDEDARRQQRTALETAARARFAALPLTGRDATRFAERARINDACLAIQGTYVADTPQYREVLERLGGDLSAFVTRLREAADADDPRASFFAP